MVSNSDKNQPFAQWEEVDVTFPSTANADCVVQHTLSPPTPEHINYMVARKSQAVDVFHDTGPNRKAWGAGYIILRSPVPNATITLLLWVSHTPRTPIFAPQNTIPQATDVATVSTPTTTITGEGRMWFTNTPPTGWLICNGSVVSRTTYAALFAVIGTAFNVGGEAGTDFRLPDFRGRVPIGVGTGTGLTARTLAQMLGTETHALAVSEMPSHDHPGSTVAISPNPHDHLMGSSTNAGQLEPVVDLAGINPANNAPSSSAVSLTATPTIAAQGGGGAHNNMQPSLGINWIIKT